MNTHILWSNPVNSWLTFLGNDSLLSPWPQKGKGKNYAVIRQAETAKLILSAWREGRPGVILADDVGLGKTWVAVLVAIAVASASGKVLISVPNQPMREKWSEEFECWYGDENPHPGLRNRTQDDRWKELHPGNKIRFLRCDKKKQRNLIDGRIMLVTHEQFFQRNNWNCDLLIVDEAHRGRDRLRNIPRQHTANFVMLLTATPFGKEPANLASMLNAVGCTYQDVLDPVREYANRAKLEQQNPQELEHVRSECENKLKHWVIRHSFETISKNEQKMLGKSPVHVLGNLAFPTQAEMNELTGSTLNHEPIPVDENENETRKLIIHSERLHTLARKHDKNCKKDGSVFGNVDTLVAPYARLSVKKSLDEFNIDNCDDAIKYHYEQMKQIVKADGLGPMEKQLETFARNCFQQGLKFIVFCSYHTTRKAVIEVLKQANNNNDIWTTEETQEHWENWHETENDRGKVSKPPIQRLTYPKGYKPQTTDWNELFTNLKTRKRALQKLSTVEGVGQDKDDCQDDEIGNSALVIPAVADLQTGSAWRYRILFNSPFHPQALVLTAKDSEGIDLHRYCRLLVHYELSYRPENVLQANGRIRRLNSLASRENEHLIYFYPYLAETRSERLTQVVVERVEKFRQMMGGVPQLSPDSLVVSSSTKTNAPDFSNKIYEKTLSHCKK